MPLRFWTLQLENKIDICLIVNGKKITEFLANKDLSRSDVLKSNVVHDILDEKDDKVKLVLDDAKEFTLPCEKLKETILFGCPISDKKGLLKFWNDTAEFLKLESDNEEKEDEEEEGEEKEGEARHSLPAMPVDENRTINDSADRQSVPAVPVPNEQEEADETFDVGRKKVFSKINSKSVGKYVIDIFSLVEPPTEYEVRTRDNEFVKKLSDQMIEKRDISIDNASNIIGTIKVEKDKFKPELIKSHNIYVIDGNHNVKAQQLAYEKTKDPLFRFREVHLYCMLNSEEALILGTSRNEDSSMSLKLTDFQRVDLVRRYLYISAGVSPEQEPPEAGSHFTKVYKQLLNLKTKNKVDSKAVIRFLATKLSCRNYEIFSSVCKKNAATKASKFEPLRGLEETAMYEQLSKLKESKCSKEDWLKFKENCVINKKEKVKNNTTATLSFNDFKADITTNEKKIASGCISIAFNSTDGMIKVMTIRELEEIIFGKMENTNKASQQKSSEAVKRKEDEPLDDAPKYKKYKEMEVKKASNLIKKTTEELRRSPRKTEKKGKEASNSQTGELRRSPRKPGKRGVYSFGSDAELSPLKATGVSKFKVHVDGPKHSTPKQMAYKGQLEKNSGTGSTLGSSMDYLSRISCSGDEVPETSVDSFLRIMVNEDIYLRVKYLMGILIEEEDVETIPDNLTQLDLLLDPIIQRNAKKYFSEDAWKVALNTFQMLKESEIKKASGLIKKPSNLRRSPRKTESEINKASDLIKKPSNLRKSPVKTGQFKKNSEAIPESGSSLDNSSRKLSSSGDEVPENSVDTFMRILVNEDAYLRVKFLKGSLIEEEDVETIPDNLTQLDLLLDQVVQRNAMKYFSEDAWKVALNTFKMLKVTSINQKICSPKKTKKPTVIPGKSKTPEVSQPSRSARVRLTDITSVEDIAAYDRQKCLRRTKKK